MVKTFISVFLSLPEQLLDEKETFPAALKRDYSIFMSEKHTHSLPPFQLHAQLHEPCKSTYVYPYVPIMYILSSAVSGLNFSIL